MPRIILRQQEIVDANAKVCLDWYVRLCASRSLLAFWIRSRDLMQAEDFLASENNLAWMLLGGSQAGEATRLLSDMRRENQELFDMIVKEMPPIPRETIEWAVSNPPDSRLKLLKAIRGELVGHHDPKLLGKLVGPLAEGDVVVAEWEESNLGDGFVMTKIGVQVGVWQIGQKIKEYSNFHDMVDCVNTSAARLFQAVGAMSADVLGYSKLDYAVVGE